MMGIDKGELKLVEAEDKALEIAQILTGENYSIAAWILHRADEIIQARAIVNDVPKQKAEG